MIVNHPGPVDTTTYTVSATLNGEDAFSPAKFKMLRLAIQFWDANTFNLEGKLVGGIAVQSWDANGLMVRDGWILHQHENGSVFLTGGLIEDPNQR